MGIDFRIGEAVIGHGYGEVWIDVIEADPVIIPNIENYEPDTNYFGAGYGTHANMIKFCEGEELFNKLIPTHPAKVHLSREMLAELDKVIEVVRLKHPALNPRFSEDHEPYTADNYKAAHLARLLRFRYWIAWALDNCKIPTLYNW